MRDWICVAAVAAGALAWSSNAAAQRPAWTPEFSAAAGLGHVFRWQDQTYGNPLSAGVAVAIAHDSGWAFEIHTDKTFGLEPIRVRCGLNVECVGIAHEGPTAMATTTIGVRFGVGGGRVRPYIVGGLGLMRSDALHSLTRVRGPIAIVSEHATSDRGFGPDLGGGVRIPVGPSWSVNAELRWLDAPWLSRENLAATRVMTRVTYALR